MLLREKVWQIESSLFTKLKRFCLVLDITVSSDAGKSAKYFLVRNEKQDFNMSLCFSLFIFICLNALIHLPVYLPVFNSLSSGGTNSVFCTFQNVKYYEYRTGKSVTQKK